VAKSSYPAVVEGEEEIMNRLAEDSLARLVARYSEVRLRTKKRSHTRADDRITTVHTLRAALNMAALTIATGRLKSAKPASQVEVSALSTAATSRTTVAEATVTRNGQRLVVPIMVATKSAPNADTRVTRIAIKSPVVGIDPLMMVIGTEDEVSRRRDLIMDVLTITVVKRDKSTDDRITMGGLIIMAEKRGKITDVRRERNMDARRRNVAMNLEAVAFWEDSSIVLAKSLTKVDVAKVAAVGGFKDSHP
jgi:hypothetical protein